MMANEMVEQLAPTNAKVLSEARELAEEIVADIELTRVQLGNVALKASRLARLLNDFDYRKIFQFEAGGYPSGAEGIPAEVFALGKKAGRVTMEEIGDGEKAERMSTLSIDAMLANIESAKAQLSSAGDAPYSVSSANPNQILQHRPSNRRERDDLRTSIRSFTMLLSGCQSRIYDYAMERLIELSYSEIASDAFARIRAQADKKISDHVPQAVEKFSAVYTNLKSDNAEDWANAVHSCRRILQAVADQVFPSTEPQNRNGRRVALGPDQYINRLVCYVEDKSASGRFQDIVGSHLRFMGERLDAIFQAAQKGSHAEISTREEADRYVVYTYMIVRDILMLADEEANQAATSTSTDKLAAPQAVSELDRPKPAQDN